MAEWLGCRVAGSSPVQTTSVVLDSFEFNTSSTLVNSQLVCLLGIFNHSMFFYFMGEWSIKIFIVLSTFWFCLHGGSSL